MNHYTLADMKPGLAESFTVTVTQEMMDQFLAITGDCSPIHVDADYAKGRGYPAFSPRWPASICPASTACSTASSASSPAPSLWGTR